MKKVKIMLLTITVLAATGGVLAFKAKAKGENLYCTAAYDGNSCPQKCNAGGFDGKIDTSKPLVCYTLTSNTSNCASANLDCNVNPTRITPE